VAVQAAEPVKKGKKSIVELAREKLTSSRFR
jgi:hypothetical protein